MRVLRRRLDNYVQFGSFLFIGVLLPLLSRNPAVWAVGALLVVLAVRTLRAGVYLDDAGITIRNTFRTYRISWPDFERADIAGAGAIPIPAVVLRRKTGADVALWCIQPPGRGKRGQPRLAAVLQEVQGAIRAVHPEAEPS